MHLIFIKMMFIFQNTKRKKKCDKETKYQLFYLLFLETESKSILYVLLFFFLYRQIYSTSCLRHAIPSLLLQKVALSFQCLRPQKKPARKHSVIYSCIINYKLLTVIYF